jgi:NTE family protein
MNRTTIIERPVAPHTVSRGTPQRIVLALQGGGALGAYQAGVYEALQEAGLMPDWVIGTSIGAINGSVIAGNEGSQRLAKLRTFWDRVAYGTWSRLAVRVSLFGTQLASWMTMLGGLDGFFKPNPLALFGPHWPLGADHVGYYSTTPLARTLADLIDFDVINRGVCRLTVGAANVRTAEMRYFDSRDTKLDVRHVMASSALPPAFPPVRIDGQLYWDGGILSNTPVEAVFDDYPRRSALVFVVHLWNPEGPEPSTMWETIHRQKELQYASRAKSHIMRQKQIHHLRHIISELAARLDEEVRATKAVQELAGYGCLTQIHVVRLLAPALGAEDHTKNIDFDPANIRARWQAGWQNTRDVLARAPWMEPVDPLEGFVLHEAVEGRMTMVANR